MHINGIRGITIHITEFKIHISILKTIIQHYSSIIFTYHPFQPSSIALLKVIFFLSVLLLMLLNYKRKNVLTSHRLAAFRSQCQWTRIFVVNCSVRTCVRHKNIQVIPDFQYPYGNGDSTWT